jgi:hypothetical protein
MPRPMLVVPLAQVPQASTNSSSRVMPLFVSRMKSAPQRLVSWCKTGLESDREDSLNGNRKGNSHGAFQMQDPGVSFCSVEKNAQFGRDQVLLLGVASSR